MSGNDIFPWYVGIMMTYFFGTFYKDLVAGSMCFAALYGLSMPGGLWQNEDNHKVVTVASTR